MATLLVLVQLVLHLLLVLLGRVHRPPPLVRVAAVRAVGGEGALMAGGRQGFV